MTDSASDRPFPLKIGGSGSRFISCPDCGERLDKEDIVYVLEHEESCPGPADIWPPGESPSQPPEV
jgi:hypothetical protein